MSQAPAESDVPSAENETSEHPRPGPFLFELPVLSSTGGLGVDLPGTELLDAGLLEAGDLHEEANTAMADGANTEPALARRRDPAALRRRLIKTMLRAVVQHELIRSGDRILVALSGGKDSYTMFDLLEEARRRSPVRYEIVGFHLDQGQPGYDGSALEAWLRAFGVEHYVHHEDTYSIVLDMVGSSGDTYCGPCSRLRRGILYTWAERLGCNKIALGHHRDDALETFFLNLFYAGRLQAMPAIYRTGDGRFEVIRPLIACEEADIASHAVNAGYPILPCNLCGSQEGLRRDRIARLLADLEREHPDLRKVAFAALENVRPTHLLDREVAAAWNDAAHRYPPRR
jgi:tRNA 2-thiocytidine biosynthesis protein TtcA